MHNREVESLRPSAYFTFRILDGCDSCVIVSTLKTVEEFIFISVPPLHENRIKLNFKKWLIVHKSVHNVLYKGKNEVPVL